MSTVALAVGLLVGNMLHPGQGLNLTSELAKKTLARLVFRVLR